MYVEDVEYEADGRTMVGHLVFAPGAGGRRPGVLVAHEGPGLDEHARGAAYRLAELGYVAFALDYHGGGKPLPVAEMMDRITPLIGEPQRTRALGQAGLDVLLARPEVDGDRVAAIGFCFGGTMALELARAGADLRAVIGLHSGLATTEPAPSGFKPKVLVCLGADDPTIPAEQRAAFEDEMRAAGADWQIHLYGDAVHGFTNPRAAELGFPGVAYDARADARSWRAVIGHLAETLSP